MDKEKESYTVAEASKILNKPVWQIQRAIREGKIRAFRTSERGNWNILHEDLVKIPKAPTRIFNIDTMPDTDSEK